MNYKKIYELLKYFKINNKGASAVEYGIALALFGVVMAVSMSDLGPILLNYLQCSTSGDCTATPVPQPTPGG